MNALAHALEALYTPLANPVTSMAALRAAALLPTEDRESLALGALLAGYASGSTGIAVHHAVCQTLVRTTGTPHAETNAVMLPHSARLMEGRAPEAVAAFQGGGGGRPVRARRALRAHVARFAWRFGTAATRGGRGGRGAPAARQHSRAARRGRAARLAAHRPLARASAPRVGSARASHLRPRGLPEHGAGERHRSARRRDHSRAVWRLGTRAAVSAGAASHAGRAGRRRGPGAHRVRRRAGPRGRGPRAHRRRAGERPAGRARRPRVALAAALRPPLGRACRRAGPRPPARASSRRPRSASAAGDPW